MGGRSAQTHTRLWAGFVFGKGKRHGTFLSGQRYNPRMFKWIFKRRRKRRSRSRKGSQGSFRRFMRTVGLSALFSFLAVSWALHPQVFSEPRKYIRAVKLPQFSVTDLYPQQLGEKLSSWMDLGPLLARLDLDLLDPEPERTIIESTDNGYVQTDFSRCPHFFPDQYQPIVPAQAALRTLCFTPFAILYSGDRKTPVFVAQRLNREMLQAAQKVKRTDRFYEEARLPQADRARLSDYRGSGFDRGHMAPAGDMHDEESMAQSFSLANIVPQNARHNRGAWSKIEQDTRKYIKRAQGDVYVFTGPVYSAQPETIGEHEVAIPTYLYKVVYDATTRKAWVHWHENSEHARAGPPISYEEFVQRTGLHFLSLDQLH